MDEGMVKGDVFEVPDDSHAGNLCPIGGGTKVCCGMLVSKLREAYGAVQDELLAKQAATQKHMDACKIQLDEMEEEIGHTKNGVNSASARFSETTAFLAGLQLQ